LRFLRDRRYIVPARLRVPIGSGRLFKPANK
jgi:hypothetical protein